MRDLVTFSALIASVICFAIYVIDAWRRIFPPTPTVTQSLAGAATELSDDVTPSVADLGKLAEALAKLTDSLSKAGPSLTSLIGALAFLIIAAVSDGALQGSPTAPASKPGAEAGKTENATTPASKGQSSIPPPKTPPQSGEPAGELTEPA